MQNAQPPKTPLLIVDDDKAVLRLLARVAERAGFDVDTAKDGLQAMEMLTKKQYDIAIIDLMMPRMSGYELVQKISTLSPRPVVLVATALMNGDVATLDDSMVRRVIKKPFDINAVAAALVETAKDIAEKRGASPPSGVTVIADKATVLANEVKVVAPQEVKVIGAPVEPPPAQELAPPAAAAEEKPPAETGKPVAPPEKNQ
ncbi:MAG TPA: response regulator [Thermoanaerobaculia bacterium]|nr:response regulator [Thermoanaerobaculia bacterium]